MNYDSVEESLLKQTLVPGDKDTVMNNYDVKCRIIEEELKTFWPQWHVIQRLGGGAFGDVFEIYRDNFGIREKSALKMIQISDGPATMALIQPVGGAVSRAQDGQAAVPEAFRNEIQIMEALRGAPNIVIIEDFHLKRDTSSTILFVRMELLTGFQQLMAERQIDQKPFTIPEVLKIGRDICTALMFCEKKGIIHRDIKPANLFVDGFGCFKVGDFGVSRRMDTVHVALTMTGIGTISYMAPEVYRGTSYNNTVDIYALGLILYQLLNNYRIPFLPTDGSYTPKDIDSANYRRLHGEPLPSLTGTRIGNETVDASLDAMIRKACAIRSEDRYQSAKEFYEDLSAWGTPLAKKFQENIPQGQTENTPQQVRPTQQEQHSRKPQEAVLPWDDEQFQTTPFSFINDVQDADSLHTGIQDSGKQDVHEPEYSLLNDEKESKNRQKKGGLGKIAAVSALIMAVLLAGARYNMLRGLQASPDSSSSSASLASSSGEAESGTLFSTQDDSVTESGQQIHIEYTVNEDGYIVPVEGGAINLTADNNERVLSDSWDEIITAGEDGSYANKYQIGDLKELDLGDEGVIRMELVAIDADELADGSGKAHMTWIAKDLLNSEHYINEEEYSSFNWQDSDMREWLRESILPLFPENVRSNIKEVTKYCYDLVDVNSCVDTIWIPCSKEVLGRDYIEKWGLNAETGVEYSTAFPDDESRKKGHIGASIASEWWLRCHYDDDVYASVHDDGSAGDASSETTEYGVAIGFCF